MNGYFCADCEEAFEYPSLEDETRWEEYQGVRVRHVQCSLVCPFCQSYSVEETRLCETCKTDRAMDGVDYCFAHLPQDILEDDKEIVESMRNT